MVFNDNNVRNILKLSSKAKQSAIEVFLKALLTRIGTIVTGRADGQ